MVNATAVPLLIVLDTINNQGFNSRHMHEPTAPAKPQLCYTSTHAESHNYNEVMAATVLLLRSYALNMSEYKVL